MPSQTRSTSRPLGSAATAWRGAVAALALAAGAAGATPACSVQSGPAAVPVIELYTSEGCSSCPPADRWLSRLGDAEPGAVALAFHVDYWDRLGWKDRFAKPAFTERQAAQLAGNGGRFSYTPQVVVDGRDRKDWPRALPAAPRPPARVAIALAREQDGAAVVATVSAAAAAPARLAAYWAVTEQAHATAVRAGENEGATLHHDFVVRDYEAVAAWTSTVGAPRVLRFTPAGAADPAHPRAVNLVVVDAADDRPLQAAKLGC